MAFGLFENHGITASARYARSASASNTSSNTESVTPTWWRLLPGHGHTDPWATTPRGMAARVSARSVPRQVSRSATDRDWVDTTPSPVIVALAKPSVPVIDRKSAPAVPSVTTSVGWFLTAFTTWSPVESIIAASPDGSPATIRVDRRIVSARSSPVIFACPASSMAVVTFAKVASFAHSSSPATTFDAVTAPSAS